MDQPSTADEAWTARLRRFEDGVARRDAEELRAAQALLRERAETHGLSPAEAELLGQINMTLGA